MVERLPIYLPSETGTLRQGEIITGLLQTCLNVSSILVHKQDDLALDYIIHPYVIIVSQDCDLTQDFNARLKLREKGRKEEDKKKDEHNLLPNVLFCEVVEAGKLRNREPKGSINSTQWNNIKNNKDDRYQFLQKISVSEDALGQGLEELSIDFKRYFTIPTEEVYLQTMSMAKRRCKLNSPYTEHLNVRFHYFQFRVGLPQDHESV